MKKILTLFALLLALTAAAQPMKSIKGIGVLPSNTPEQSHNDPSKIIAYPPTIQVSKTKNVERVTL